MKEKLVIPTVVVAVLLMVGWKLSESHREKAARKHELVQTSDVGKFDRVVKIWGDDWLGYLITRSQRFRRALEPFGLGVQFEMVFDFKERFVGLAKGRCDFVVATIDSYLLNARDLGYPGVITFVVDESYGGDAIIGGPSAQSLDALNGKGVRGALVGFSPSEFLLKAEISHFKLTELLSRVPAFRLDKAEVAFKKLAAQEVDFAVLWEPFTSQALQTVRGAKRLIDTSEARGIIIDVAIASRKVVADEPKLVENVTRAYFSTLRHYLDHADEFKELAKADSGKDLRTAERMFSGIKFVSFADNCHYWFAIGDASDPTREERLVQSIRRIADILIDVGDLRDDPLSNNPQTIVFSKPLLSIFGDPKAKADLAVNRPGAISKPGTKFFRPLSPEQWQKVAEQKVGTLVDEPITFGSGQAEIPDDFRELLKTAVHKLAHYPNHRVVIDAHVSPGSDAQADQELSQQRALSIKAFLVRQCNVAEERVLARGLGGSSPPQKYPNESLRAWKRRCRRARVYLAQE